MDCIYVKEEVIDENEFETHPLTDTGDGKGLIVGENVKKEIDFDEALEMDSRRDSFGGEGAIEDEKKKARYHQDLELVVKKESASTAVHHVRNIKKEDKRFHCDHVSLGLNERLIFFKPFIYHIFHS